MQSELFIPGKMPGLNELIRWKGSRYKGAYNTQKKRWARVIGSLLEQQHIVADMPRYEHGVHLWFHLKEPDRRRDPDNALAGATKFVIDGLVKALVIKTDGWKGVLGLRCSWEVDKREPGVLVRMSDTPW